MIIKLLGPLWALWLMFLFLWILKKKHVRISIKHPIIWLLAITLLVRIIPAFILQPGSNYDIDSFRLVADNVRDLKDIYTVVDTGNRHPYLPLQMYWIGFSGWFADKTGLGFNSIVRLAPIIADCLIVLLLYKVFLKKQIMDPIIGGLLYALNPVSVYVSAYHGQFDSIPLLFLLVSLFYAGTSAYKSGFWLGLGIWIKSWPVIGLPIILNSFRDWKKKIQFGLAMVIFPLVGVIIYLLVFQADFFTTIGKALGYNHGIGVWGYTYLLKILANSLFPKVNIWEVFGFSRFVTIGILGLVWFFYARKQSPFSGVLTLLLTFFVFTHAFSIQYLVWLIPFGILIGDLKWIKLYTMAAFAYMLLVYHTLILEMTITNIMPWPLADTLLIIPASIPVWMVTIFWFLDRKKKYNSY